MNETQCAESFVAASIILFRLFEEGQLYTVLYFARAARFVNQRDFNASPEPAKASSKARLNTKY